MVHERELDLAITELKLWLTTQHHLPQKILPLVLKRYYLASKSNAELAKKLIELSYTLRNAHPHIFFERDPLLPGVEKAFAVTDMLPLPKLTEDKNRVLFYRLIDMDPKNYIFDDVIRAFFLMADLRLSMSDVPTEEATVCNGEIPVFDMTGFSWRHATKAVISTLRVYMKFTQEGAPVTLRNIHVINCPSFVDRVFMIVKPFLKREVSKMIHFHLPNSETLYEHIPRDLLPNEYGGTIGSTAEIKQNWMKKMKSHRDYLLDPNVWKIDESKRKLTAQNNLELNQGIRSLSID